MNDVIKYSIDIFEQARDDLEIAKSNFTGKDKKYKYGLLFQGIIHNVTIPVLTEVVKEKIPFLGGLLKVIIFKALSRFSQPF